jgi:N-acetylneuraminic acid mutarotase
MDLGRWKRDIQQLHRTLWPPGAYGTLGTPAAGNIPGGRDSAVSWSDKGGNFWLFGGEGVDANGNYGQLNDLWEFQPSTQQWIWMGGSSALPSSCAGSATVPCGQPGTYGTLGVAAASNLPGGRSAAAYWTDSNGYLWMFGGFGFDASGTLGELNDLWEFDPSTKGMDVDRREQHDWQSWRPARNLRSPRFRGCCERTGRPLLRHFLDR